jgi:hypothetical protein
MRHTKNNGIAGIGYVFSADDPYTGIDIDHCRDPETGQLKYCAQVAIEYLDSYSEKSPSGTGTHTIAEAEWPVNGGNSKTFPCGMKIEVYDRLRYFTVTGRHLEGTPNTIEARQTQLTALHTAIFGKPKAPPKDTDSGPSPTIDLPDQELIKKACQAADGEKFGRLWRGDTSGYSTPSHADYALVHLLAFWTNKDPERIDRLFRQSGLCQDPERLKKWERLAAQTIRKAIANTPEGYDPGKAKGKRRKKNTQATPDTGGESQAKGSEPINAPRVSLCGHLYFIDGGRLCLEGVDREGKPKFTPLANFQARITEEVTWDDGLRALKEFHLTGSLDTGRPLPLARIPAKEFDSLNWISREWGAAASVAPGRSLTPHLVTAIKAHSQDFKRRTVFAHTGWRKINGVWRYLHGGGAIGPGVACEVDLGANLHLYHLPEPGGIEAARASLRFLDIGPWEVTAPLIACAYLAPFADLLKIDFSLWLYGPTGSMKSTLAALALCHFGEFDRLSLPGSWFSTANSLEKLCFTVKDGLVVIDDFIPATSAKDAHKMSETAGRLIYQAGNRSGRGRLTSDLSARPNHYPRCLIVSTGEMLLPGRRQSATARYLGVEFDSKKTPIDRARLTAAQREARLYPGAMAAYLEDLAPRLEDAQAEIRELWEGYRDAFQSAAHLRIPEIQAWLAVGFELFLKFQTLMGTISQGEADEMLERAWRVFKALGERHSRIIEGDRPTLKFLAVLRELFYQSRVYVESATVAGAPPQAKETLGWEGTEPAKNAELVGWADDGVLYLMPEMTVKVVQETIHRQVDFLPLGKNDLLAALAREGFIEPGKGENTKSKWIQGASKRVICLPLKKLFHSEVPEGKDE